MIENASEKKFCEEINYSKRKRKSIISKTEMIGMFHWDTQGRKPEFVIYMELNITMLDLNLIQSENHNNFPTQYQFQIYKNNKFIHDEWKKSLAILKDNTCSTQLYMCMKILEDYFKKENKY